MRRSAFTLIELLVVISIIAILASIAIPVFNSAIEKARATTDAANLKNLGVGINAYLNDNDDQMFPLAGTEPWPVVLQKKYVTDWKVFHSPFDKREKKDRAPGAPVSYGINEFLFDQHASTFKSPSELIMAAPSATGSSDKLTFGGTSETAVKLTKASGGGANKSGTHSKGNMINALFADTHVSNLTWNDYSAGNTEAGMRRWYPKGRPADEE